MKLEEKLVDLRKKKGLTQLKLAEAMNVSRQAISRWEVGDAMPSTENLKTLSEIYQVPIEYLLNNAYGNPNQEQDKENKKGSVIFKQHHILVGLIISFAILIMVIIYCGYDLNEKEDISNSMIEEVGGEIITDGEFDLEW